MNVSTIAVSEDQAMMKIADIEALKKSQRTEEDDALLALYKAVRRHNSRVIDIGKAFRQTGLNELGQPKMAIARADWKDVAFSTRDLTLVESKAYYRSGVFFEKDRPGRTSSTINLPDSTFPAYRTGSLWSPVPYVPAEHRPKFNLRNYHILFEVEKWNEYPVDPFLLKHVTGNIYMVLAEWDLTEVEASILGGMRGL